jgi:ferredoxin
LPQQVDERLCLSLSSEPALDTDESVPARFRDGAQKVFGTRRRSTVSNRVTIDEDECIGCGSCEEICPEVFKLNEETEKAEVIKPEGGPEDLIQEAIDTCPVSCIHWED